ncbi:PP2C family serine/threonine-protein phosphatase [Enterovirga rhinocerotis]|uniref:Protein phosphatase 2C-like protein n=1 Tax=Enterovirga rhinocerotis TaxID=1339210 RepID=A0A4R7C5W7_9HYPH|nr:PP2C family serine/threonine-protein phosphatase [Enterovirga rhinocerotis]TDR93960.1 protein phosphatase 2C-like protein [Enterovirga rhinocerotis]
MSAPALNPVPAAMPVAVGGVSVRGTSHILANMPNQDAHAHERDGDWTYLAVADGHGSSRHYRSDRGSAFAVATALLLLRRAARAIEAGGHGSVLATVADDLVGSWRERVEADIRLWPIPEAPGFDSHAVYGSTCIAAAIGPGCSLFLQIGDGDVLASAPGGEVDRVVPLDPHLVGAGTYSLCQPDAVARVHLRLFTAPHPLSAPDFVMASTDGLSKSYTRDEDFLLVARHFRSSLRSLPLSRFLRDLEPWLAECSGRGSRDDVTVALFSGMA